MELAADPHEDLPPLLKNRSVCGETRLNATLEVALLIGTPILLLFALSGRRFTRTPTVSAAFPVLGAACLLVMVLTHVAEGLNLFPAMGWGQRRSIGHYLDLTATSLGIAFLVAAALCPLLKRKLTD